MLRLILVRHAESEANARKVHAGNSNPGLTIKGRRQAEGLRDRLAGERIDAIYCSGMKRAIETAQILAGDRPITSDPRLNEVDHAVLEGLPAEEVVRRFGEHPALFKKDPAFRGLGESQDDARQRIEPFYRELRKKHEGHTVLIVGHGLAHGVSYSTLFKGLPRDYLAHIKAKGETTNASLTRIHIDNGKARIVETDLDFGPATPHVT